MVDMRKPEALLRPNGCTLNSYYIYFVLKAVFGIDYSLSGI